MSGLVSKLKSELESNSTEIGKGWISGVLGLFLAVIAMAAVLCIKFPDLFTVPEIRKALDLKLVRLILYFVIFTSFFLSVISLILREKKLLGLTAVVLNIVAVSMGGSNTQTASDLTSSYYFGIDWFFLNLILTGIIFLPLERLFKRVDQKVFRYEWREDLFYFFVSSILVQLLTYLTAIPSKAILSVASLESMQNFIGSQHILLQILEIMILTDFIQYWVHRSFHQIKFLWYFHAIHHSAERLDWLAGSRMHFLEIICLRSLTVIPMYICGFAPPAIYAYLIIVYVYSTYIHSNLKWDVEFLKPFIVTPRFHHWHHGKEEEAIDVNFAIHFPIFDRLFGTYHMPKGRWPEGLGVQRHKIPKGFIAQFMYPFRRK